MPRLLQHRERQAARGAQVAAPFLRHPRKEIGLREHRHAAELEDPLQVLEGDGGVELVDQPDDGERVADAAPIATGAAV